MNFQGGLGRILGPRVHHRHPVHREERVRPVDDSLRPLGFGEGVVYRAVKGRVDVSKRIPVLKQRRVHGESINVTTWLHTGDVLMSQQKQKKGRIVRIERIIYNDDLTCTYVLEPVSGAHVSRRVGGKLTVRPMRYTTHTHENTVRGQYFRISTGEKRVL